MLILEPVIDEPMWINMGVSMIVRSYLYVRAETAPFERGATVDGEKPVPVYVHLLGNGDEPSVITNNRDDGVVAEALHDWIAVHGLVDLWKKEAALYKEVVNQVRLPFMESTEPAEPADRLMKLYYQLELQPSGDYELPPLRVEVRVEKPTEDKSGVTASLLVALPYEEEYCSLCSYPLELPVTVASVKTSVKGPLQQYLRAIDAPKANGGLHLKADHDIDWVRWDNDGVTLSLGLNIHKGHQNVSTYIWIVGKDSPRVVVPTPTAHPDRNHWIDEAMPLIHELIAERGLMAVWEREAAAYREVMKQVDMGDVVPVGGHSKGGAPYLLYLVSMTAPGAKDLELRVKVHKGGRVEAVLHVVNDALPVGASTPNTYCDLCTYELELPITLIDLKAKVRETLMDYMPS